MTTQQEFMTFETFDLNDKLLTVINKLGFLKPTEVQALAIPAMKNGHDVIVQSKTGTGKTAAFSLPIIDQINFKSNQTQCLVLAPTRELALQVTEAIDAFCQYQKNHCVTAIYGGSEYRQQIRALKKGCQIVVGTPGRVMDHIRRGTLQLNNISHLVLDEADEMLRMGFIDDVEWILSHTPEQKQMALFSATMPSAIKKIAKKYLHNVKEIQIKHKSLTVDRIKQQYAITKDEHKVEAISRILEFNEHDGTIVFSRTKLETQQITDQLIKKGIRAEALNGDLAQATRKKCIDKLKNRKIDVIVATDVAARGIDIERISCVINVDIPYDHETYVHRIGRTGRAGRIGDAILLVTPRQQGALRRLENAVKTKLTLIEVPSINDIKQSRLQRLADQLKSHSQHPNLDEYKAFISEFVKAEDIDLLDLAASLIYLNQQNNYGNDKKQDQTINQKFFDSYTNFKQRKNVRSKRERNNGQSKRGLSTRNTVEKDMARYRISVGRDHGVKPGNIVGAIANEANLNSRSIGRVSINRKHSFVDLPANISSASLKRLRNSKILGKKIELTQER